MMKIVKGHLVRLSANGVGVVSFADSNTPNTDRAAYFRLNNLRGYRGQPLHELALTPETPLFVKVEEVGQEDFRVVEVSTTE
jgi:hypothetical protein